MTDVNTSSGFDRRTVVKGAAWSVPVIAAAVAVPMASASMENGADVRVTATCAGQYDISDLEALLSEVSPLGLPLDLTLLTNLVKAALGVLGFNEGATRRFDISAASGTIPSGTEFDLVTEPGALIDVTILQSLLQVQALFVAAVNDSTFRLTTGREITAASPMAVELQELLLDADVITRTSLSLVSPQDTPLDPANEAPDFAEINTLASVDVNLGTLDLGRVLETVLPGFANALLRTTIRALLGVTGGLSILNNVNLRVQRCRA